jgi:NADH:ubiquinone oxidoreductase subunit 5 (subunit L)/multisubunit Na+/H+ antiporter MnhA subunit
MPWIIKNLWLIPALPMLAAGLSALAPRRCRRFSASLAIGSMVIVFLLSLCAFAHTLSQGEGARQVFNFNWFQFGDQWVQLGWVLDPLTAVMLVMVTFVGTLIFIYSVGYMAHDENFTRFFTFLALFAGAMLGVVIANSLLLLFICWELVGLTSVFGITNRVPRRRRKRRSSLRALGTSRCCWAWSGFIPGPTRCFFIRMATGAWNMRFCLAHRSRNPTWASRSPRRLAC